jgi:hypothetical protein
VPPEVEWFANLTNPQTRRAYENAVTDFMRFAGIMRPEEFRTVTRGGRGRRRARSRMLRGLGCRRFANYQHGTRDPERQAHGQTSDRCTCCHCLLPHQSHAADDKCPFAKG